MQAINFDLPTGSPSEDCLFLNIWTPTLNSSANLPVMLWLHGGNFRYGSGTQRISIYLSLSQVYDGSCFVMREVVVITINYRLGVYGFINNNSSDSPGNQGLWDQAMAHVYVEYY